MHAPIHKLTFWAHLFCFEKALRKERIDHELEAQKLVADIEAHKVQITQEQREKNVTTDQLMRMLKERDELALRGDELAKCVP